MSMRKLAIVNALMFSALTLGSNMPMLSSIPSTDWSSNYGKSRRGQGRNFTPKSGYFGL